MSIIKIKDQKGLADEVKKDLGGDYILANDIDLDSNGAGFDADGWKPIDMFAGTFDGNGYKITGLWIDRPNDNNVGLFGYIQNAKIKNLKVEIAEDKEVMGHNSVGAIAGSIHKSSITDSYSKGNIRGNNYVGGITGNIHEDSIVANSRFEGNIKGWSSIGGITGAIDNSKIVNSCSTRYIRGSSNVGGITGDSIGGSIKNSCSTGSVIGALGKVGGIAGNIENSSITNSYSESELTGNGYVGGIVGNVQYSSVTNNAAINPSINSPKDTANRIAGYINGGTVSDNFALDNMSGTFTDSGNDDNHGINKTETELKSRSTYEKGLGWKFGINDANPWKIDERKSYPYLYC